MTVKDGDFWLEGKKWYPVGVNYWPRYAIALEQEDYVFPLVVAGLLQSRRGRAGPEAVAVNGGQLSYPFASIIRTIAGRCSIFSAAAATTASACASSCSHTSSPMTRIISRAS